MLDPGTESAKKQYSVWVYGMMEEEERETNRQEQPSASAA